MKKHLKTALLCISMTILLNCIACKKESGDHEETCRVCIARDNIEGAPIENAEVCTDEAEQNFRNKNEGFIISCE